ncbi:MAG: hypothetical protein U5J99_01600 [Parvularculaceae bacterium]|nr:hypothetical protein [Parvularculaceae bacterium]
MQAAKLDAVPEAKLNTAAGDDEWSKANLRFDGAKPLKDLANCLRVFENHPEYKGRFRFNEMLNKVVDRGAVMVEWRINEITADLQERFMPDVAPENVSKALFIAANRASAK